MSQLYKKSDDWNKITELSDRAGTQPESIRLQIIQHWPSFLPVFIYVLLLSYLLGITVIQQ